MSGQTRSLTFDVTTADAQTLAALKRIQKGLRDTGEEAETSGKKGAAGAGHIETALKTAAVAAAGRWALGEAEEAQQTEALTAARIKSTGNAAEVSAKQQGQYVDQLSKLAAVDDEVIAGGANMLRTFTNVKGEAFEPALESALDLSAAMGTDLQSSVVLVGKALNDPVKGLTALTRVGVTFTQQQKDQIRAMAEAGDVAGAQKLIIAELQKEFGGSAKAMATDSARTSVAMANAGEAAGQILAPGMQKAAGTAEFLSQGFQELPRPIQTGTLVMGAAAAGVAKLDGALGDAGLKGTLTSDVTELGKFSTALAVAGTGLAAYGTTKALLDSSVAYKGDLGLLREDLDALASGAAPASDAVEEVGGSLDDLAKAFSRVGGDSLGSRWSDAWRGDWTEIPKVKQAKETLKALDDTLADMARTDPKAASTAVLELSKALEAEGISQTEMIAQLPRYGRALRNAKRDSKDLADQSTDTKDRTADLTAVWEAHADAMGKVNTETERMLSAGFDEFHANEAYEQTATATEVARRELANAKKEGDPKKIAAAEDKLSDAIIAQVEAKGRQAEATAKANGEQITAGQVAEIQRGALVSLHEQTGVNTSDMDLLLWRLTLTTNQFDEMTEAVKRNETALYNHHKVANPVDSLGSSAPPGAVNAELRDGSSSRAASARSSSSLMSVEHLHVGEGIGMRDLEISLRRASARTATRVLA